MNNPFKNFLLASCMLLGVSCEEAGKEEPTVLEVSQTEIESGPSEEILELNISSNVSWKITVDEAWASVNPDQGQGDTQVTFSLAENLTSAPRSLEARIVGGGIVRSVRISQGASVPEFPDFYIPADETDMRPITSLQLAGEMGLGWNVGNSLEATGGETAWGNPKISKLLIDQVKAAGFNAIRIPVAWSKFSNPTSFTIEEEWMGRVQEVVDYVIANDMYAILNIHWDGGWMQPTFAQQEYVQDRLRKMWIQIAVNFRDYGDHLLFAGTNEVMVTGDYGVPKPEYYTVQNAYNQTFVETVRSTGGRNTYRNLVVQTFNTNIDHGISFFEMPQDPTEDRLMVEVHYYDPYEFALKEDGSASQWGKLTTDPSKAANWGNESHVDAQFRKIKTEFVDKGIPVLVGEFGAISRLNVTGHETFRTYYVGYVTSRMKANGLIPFYWDNGYAGNYGFALFDRNTGAQLYPELIQSMKTAQ